MPKFRSCGGTHTGGSSPNTVRSAMRISPPLGVSSPATQRRRVVLPEPLAPTMTKNSPSSTSRSRRLSAAETLPSVTMNSLRSSRMVIMRLVPTAVGRWCQTGRLPIDLLVISVVCVTAMAVESTSLFRGIKGTER